MDCTESLIYINGHIDGVNTEAEEALLQEHLNTCPQCRALLAQYEQLDRQLADVPAPPADLTEQILAQLPKKRKRRGLLYFAAPAATLATAAILALAVFGAMNLPAFAAKSNEYAAPNATPKEDFTGSMEDSMLSYASNLAPSPPMAADGALTETMKCIGGEEQQQEYFALSSAPVLIVWGDDAESYYTDLTPLETVDADGGTTLHEVLQTLLPDASVLAEKTESTRSVSSVTAYTLPYSELHEMFDRSADACEITFYAPAGTSETAEYFLLLAVTP